MTYTLKDILHLEVGPALGCTEPVAIALCAAAAVSVLPGRDMDRIEIWVDPNIYKNGLAVAIPGTGGLSGMDMAAAIGVVGGDPSLGLEVLEPVDAEVVRQARQCLAEGRVQINLMTDHRGLYIRCAVIRGKDRAEAVVEKLHDNIVSISLNDQPVLDSPLLKTQTTPSGSSPLADLETWLKQQTVEELMEIVDNLDDDDLEFLRQGVDVNMRLADYGLKHGSGLGIGKALERLVRQKLIHRDMIIAARILASAAADARMAGVKMPAMSSAGSGNHGLTAILPIWALKDFVACDETTLLKAIALSHVITAYIKAHTGRLSAICGCSVAAGAGAAAGAVYVLGGDHYHVAGAIKNLAEDLAGVICDGAKAGCALKLATAAGTAIQAALFSLQGVFVQPTDGIIGISPEQTMQNLGTLSTQGMIETDRTILRIMLAKKFSG